MIISLLIGVIILATLGYSCWRAAGGRGRQSRVGWILDAMSAVLAMIIARQLLSWSTIPPLLWFVPVVIIAVTAALVVRRWHRLPWLTPGRRRRTTVAGSAVGATIMIAAGALLIG